MAGRTHIEIKEVEGSDPWTVNLRGRAMPKQDTPMEWGTIPKYEDTSYRGRPHQDTEPTGVEYPSLVLEGEWKINHFTSTDARIESNHFPINTPQQACDMFEQWSLRGRLLEVSWSGGIVRRVRWDGTSFKPGRAGDRRWVLRFKVLGLRRSPPPVSQGLVTKSATLSSLQRAAVGIDKALSDYPPGLAPSFLQTIQGQFGAVRQALSDVQRYIAAGQDFALMPVQVLSQINTLAQAALNTITAAKEAWYAVGDERKVQIARSEYLFRAQLWKTALYGSSDAALDQLIALIAFIGTRFVRPTKYVSCAPGDSLVRIAVRVYGQGNQDLWVRIADANQLTGQIIPVGGPSRLVIPEVST